MGVPKFFRWISERYPKILQRHGCRPRDDLCQEHFGRPLPRQLEQEAKTKNKDAQQEEPPASWLMLSNDPLSECGLAPEIDRLYIDFNGILHGCSHNNMDDNADTSDSLIAGEDDDSSSIDRSSSLPSHGITEAEIFANVAYYFDRVVKDIARPKELIYVALDGVAPQAKLSQQRSRRYRSGTEGAIQRTVYDAHLESLSLESESDSSQDDDDGLSGYHHYEDDDDDVTVYHHYDSLRSSKIKEPRAQQDTVSTTMTMAPRLHEVQPGRFAGKFEAVTAMSATTYETSYVGGVEATADTTASCAFHSNAITPGSAFFVRCNDFLLQFLQDKLDHDPDWQHLQIIFSGSSVPGEGEHKIMQFIRQQKEQPSYNPNLRHCIMGQDGDLIMLALVTHEPNLMLLREKIHFGKKRRARKALEQKYGLNVYIHNPDFEFLHMNILRDYLAFEFETNAVLPSSAFDLERTIDDFVFLTFLVGNDFLPHMPALDIADEAFDLIFLTYRYQRLEWLTQKNRDKNNRLDPYLTHAGTIISGKRLESFLSSLGAHEHTYYDFKKNAADHDFARRQEAKYGQVHTPSDAVIQSKEEADRMRYRSMIASSLLQKQRQEDGEQEDDSSAVDGESVKFQPVMSNHPRLGPQSKAENEDDATVEALMTERLGSLLQISVSDEAAFKDVAIDDQDLKGRYYYDKFGMTPFDWEKHLALRKAYVEGLVWNLKYYYEGCQSWEWYYPYHYGPMLSDLVDLDKILSEISFEGKMGKPLEPFQQLLACMPPSHAKLLPEPYRRLMTEDDSPIIDFYPKSFTIDMNGKRWPFEAVVLLPFIDSGRLVDACELVDTSQLTDEEKRRNVHGEPLLLSKENCLPLESSPFCSPDIKETLRFKPELHEDAIAPLPGFPTLRDGSIKTVIRSKIKLNVHGTKSTYRTACLEFRSSLPEILPLETLGSLIGKIVYINYPHFIEAFVTAVSDSFRLMRGFNGPTAWSPAAALERKERLTRVVSNYVFGERRVGTGGMALASDIMEMEDLNILLHVRPMSGLEDGPNGKVKRFADFEMEVPLFVTSWAPVRPDPRLVDVPAMLESDPFIATDPAKKEGSFFSDSVIPKPRVPNKAKFGHQLSISQGFHSLAYSIPCASSQRLDAMQFSGALCRPPRKPSAGSLLLRTGISHSTNRRLRERSLTGVRGSVRGRLVGMGVIAAASFFTVAGATLACGKKSVNWGLTHRWSAATSWGVDTTIDGALDSNEHWSSSIFAHSGEPSQAPPLQFAHGTTTVSFVFREGIVVAVDSRASLGSFVGSKTTRKVLPIHTTCMGTMAGGAADCSFWIRKMRAEANLFELTEGYRMPVASVSRMLAHALYSNRGLGLSVGTMIVGFDDATGSSPRIFYIDNSGSQIEGDLFAVGSGATYALGILDNERRDDMSREEAVALGIKAIRHATFRDAGSGGLINVYLVTRDGWRHIFSEDVAR